jgi:hypothetical protein
VTFETSVSKKVRRAILDFFEYDIGNIKKGE